MAINSLLKTSIEKLKSVLSILNKLRSNVKDIENKNDSVNAKNSASEVKTTINTMENKVTQKLADLNSLLMQSTATPPPLRI